jgi:hypothetical protein
VRLVDNAGENPEVNELVQARHDHLDGPGGQLSPGRNRRIGYEGTPASFASEHTGCHQAVERLTNGRASHAEVGRYAGLRREQCARAEPPVGDQLEQCRLKLMVERNRTRPVKDLARPCGGRNDGSRVTWAMHVLTLLVDDLRGVEDVGIQLEPTLVSLSSSLDKGFQANAY